MVGFWWVSHSLPGGDAPPPSTSSPPEVDDHRRARGRCPTRARSFRGAASLGGGGRSPRPPSTVATNLASRGRRPTMPTSLAMRLNERSPLCVAAVSRVATSPPPPQPPSRVARASAPSSTLASFSARTSPCGSSASSARPSSDPESSSDRSPPRRSPSPSSATNSDGLLVAGCIVPSSSARPAPSWPSARPPPSSRIPSSRRASGPLFMTRAQTRRDRCAAASPSAGWVGRVVSKRSPSSSPSRPANVTRCPARWAESAAGRVRRRLVVACPPFEPDIRGVFWPSPSMGVTDSRWPGRPRGATILPVPSRAVVARRETRK